MEYWNLYDNNLNLVKENHPSGDSIPDGCYHLSVEVWPFDGQAFFLTQRSLSKKFYPGFWECTGGSAIGPESFFDAALREVREELGVTFREDNLCQLGYEVKDYHIVSVFLLLVPEGQAFSLNSREIMAGKWFTIQQMESLHLDIDFVPHQFDRYLRYVRNETFSRYLANKPTSIHRVTESHSELRFPKRGLPHSGARPDGKPFSHRLDIINKAFLVYGDTLYTKKTVLPERVNNSLGTGSPLPAKPFPLVTENICKALNSEICSQYPFPAGDVSLRKTVCEYLKREGFSSRLTPENIIFTMSTTHAFDLILRLIMRPGDAVIFTSPTYGLFAFAPERLGGETRFVDLTQEDNWLINPNSLERCIIEQNAVLAHNSGDKENPPRVVAYFHENPHNPTGKVIGPRERPLLKQIAEVCNRNSVLIIDDLLYRDLGYDRENLALPVGCFDDEFQNTISLIGLSKAYGLAGMRAGAIIADEVIIRGIRNMIFQDVDSASQLNAIALASVFCVSQERDQAYTTYFSKLIDQYLFNFSLIVAAVDGITSVGEKYQERVYQFVSKILNNSELANWWMEGIEKVHFLPNLLPESGFFCILDFSALRGMSYEGIVIQDDISLLLYLFRRYRVNFITGKSMGWPNTDQIVARFSFSVESSKIVNVFRYLKEEVELLQ